MLKQLQPFASSPEASTVVRGVATVIDDEGTQVAGAPAVSDGQPTVG